MFMALKKQWYDIIAPKEFGGTVLAQTLSSDPKHLINRVIKISYADMSKNFAKFFIKLHFRVVSVEGKECATELVAHSIQNDRIYRMVRRHTKKVTVVQDVITKDSKKVRVKTTLVLPNKANTTMRNKIRAKVEDLIAKKAATATFADLVKLLILGSFVMDIKKHASKLYPVAQIEFHKSELLGNALPGEKPVVVEETDDKEIEDEEVEEEKVEDTEVKNAEEKPKKERKKRAKKVKEPKVKEEKEDVVEEVVEEAGDE